MKTVQLKHLQNLTLANVFARKMDGNKIKHYSISMLNQYLAQISGHSIEKLLTDAVSLEEGVPVTVEIVPSVSSLPAPKDISDIVLANDPEIRLSLEKVKCKSTLYQYNESESPIKARFLTPITHFFNRFIHKINSRLISLQTPAGVDRFEYLSNLKKIFMITLLPEWGLVRRVSAAKFLSVAFEEDDLEAAVQSLLGDLKILQDNGLIMGHLAMPTMTILADTVGSGKNLYVMYVFVFTDDRKLMNIAGKTPQTLPHKFLDLIGVKNETYEGSISYLNNIDPRSKYDIEVVGIGEGIGVEEAHRIQVESYNASRPFVEESIREHAKMMSKVKATSVSEQVDRGVVVKTTFTGDEEVVSRLKRENNS